VSEVGKGRKFTAGAIAILCLVYGIVHLQVARLELGAGAIERRAAIEWGAVGVPLASLKGTAPFPWQQRLAVYPAVGLLLRAGLGPAEALSLFKTITLCLWLLALDWYLAIWFPSPASRSAGLAAASLFSIEAVPWYVFSADDFLFLAAATLFLRMVLRGEHGRWLVPLTLLGVLAKETFLTIFLVPLLGGTPGRRLRGGPILAALAAGVTLALAVRVLPPGDWSETQFKFPGNLLDRRLVTLVPLAGLLAASLGWRRRSTIRADLDSLLPWLAFYLLLIIAAGMPAEVRIWFPTLLFALPLLVERLSPAR
jgi:hypothetical protein